MRLSLATRVPYADLLAMPPELLATFILAQHDLTRQKSDHELDDGSDD